MLITRNDVHRLAMPGAWMAVRRAKIGLFVASASLLLFVGVGNARAQHFDHLKCYKIKDEAKFSATVTLDALLTQFGAEQCEVKGRGKLLCVPVDKTVSVFEDKSAVGIPPTGYLGEAISDSRICYRVKCPHSDIPPELVSDQFGSRNVERFKTQMLCTPAVHGPPPTTTTTTLPPLAACSGGSWPSCGGDCSGVGPTHLCEGRPDTSCACLLPCTDIDPGSGGFCSQGGGCPVDTECQTVAGVCTCVFSP